MRISFQHRKPIITLLLVDDHRLIRESWAAVLNNEESFQVVGAVDNANAAVAIAKDIRPSIVLMDINMSPINGFEATRMIKKSSPGSNVIGVSLHAMAGYAKKLIQMGASGYVTKNSPKEELIEAIRKVYEGENYFCSEVRNLISAGLLETSGAHTIIHHLSKRELEVVDLIRQGLSSRQIGGQLDIALKTVEVHRYNILKKLGMKNTAALVNWMNKMGV